MNLWHWRMDRQLVPTMNITFGKVTGWKRELIDKIQHISTDLTFGTSIRYRLWDPSNRHYFLSSSMFILWPISSTTVLQPCQVWFLSVGQHICQLPRQYYHRPMPPRPMPRSHGSLCTIDPAGVISLATKINSEMWQARLISTYILLNWTKLWCLQNCSHFTSSSMCFGISLIPHSSYCPRFMSWPCLSHGAWDMLFIGLCQ